ncbi:MAG: hypothetical protein NTY86_08110 [Deltaproteobacteria bacterium]|nr:hypothetical protein [Deltaproteobacteria bacterium]
MTVRDLDKARYDVVLIKGTSPRGNSGDLETRAVEANIAAAREHHVRLICLRHLVRDLQPFSDLAAFFSLLRIIRREKPPISSIPIPPKRASWADGRRTSAASRSSSIPRTAMCFGGTSTRGKPACLSY